MIEVIRPGAATLVVDLGSSRRAHRGVSIGGAADPLAHRLANRALGNLDGARALEITLIGPTLRFHLDTKIAIYGAPFAHTGVLHMKEGTELELGACTKGVRATVAFEGGLSSSLGPVGKELRVNGGVARSPSAVSYPEITNAPLRVTDGPQRGWFDDAFFAREWTATPDSNRRGIRLAGEPLVVPSREMITEGVTAGAIQVPPSGQPLILFVDQQTTGGYPKIAHVISADMHRLAQLRPGARVTFQRISFEEARKAILLP